jgi:hypothetical protein
MRELPVVYVAGNPVHPGSIWTQFGSRITDGFETDFSVVIPLDLASAIIGDRRREEWSWVDLVWNDIRVVGGSMLELYLSQIAKVTRVERTTYEWVAVCVNDVAQVGEATGSTRSSFSPLTSE